jgi:hypothetical protein
MIFALTCLSRPQQRLYARILSENPHSAGFAEHLSYMPHSDGIFKKGQK